MSGRSIHTHDARKRKVGAWRYTASLCKPSRFAASSVSPTRDFVHPYWCKQWDWLGLQSVAPSSFYHESAWLAQTGWLAQRVQTRSFTESTKTYHTLWCFEHVLGPWWASLVWRSAPSFLILLPCSQPSCFSVMKLHAALMHGVMHSAVWHSYVAGDAWVASFGPIFPWD